MFQREYFPSCRAHYANLHQFLMVYASHHQESAHSIQQLCGQLRESLQQQSVDDQLAHFVKEKGTGMDRPRNFYCSYDKQNLIYRSSCL